MKKLIKIKEWLFFKIDELRSVVGVHPKIVLWRLHIFGWSPFISKHVFKIAAISVVCFSFFISFYIFIWRSPRPFPDHALLTVERGESLSQITQTFEERGVVRSGLWLRVFTTLLGGQKRVIAGDYYFPEPASVFRVAWVLHKGEFGLIAIKTTIPEGLSSYEIADLLEKNLPNFKAEEFLAQVDSDGVEGYLFPDTYFFMPNAKASDVILTMRENFARQVSVYQEDIVKSERPINDIVIMASIIEDESNSSLDSKRIVAGILWSRLRLDMPLQVDAPFIYYNGKHSFNLTKDDLQEDHPYNTYVNKGLPPTAITNPGIDSIRAAIAPTNTEYLYFLSDKHGNMHYAKDFEGHKRNRELYIN